MKYFNGNTKIMGPIVLACLLMVFCGVSLAETQVNENAKAAADGLVIVENIAGSIKVVGWDKNEVKVEGVLSDEVKGLDFESSGKKTVIKVDYPRHMRNIKDGADLVIFIPYQSSLEIESISCAIDVTKLDGNVSVEAISGNIDLVSNGDRIEISCISGDISLEGSNEQVILESISGRIFAKGKRSEVSVESITGKVELTYATFVELEVESVDSKVIIAGALVKGGKMELESVSGDITLIVPEDISAEFSIETFSGSIGEAFGHKAEKVSQYAPGKELEFVVGGGDGRVEISTFSGDVKIKN